MRSLARTAGGRNGLPGLVHAMRRLRRPCRGCGAWPSRCLAFVPGNDKSGLDIDFTGALGGIRTPDPQIRSLVLYPAELRARGSVLTERPSVNKSQAAKSQAAATMPRAPPCGSAQLPCLIAALGAL